MHSFLFFITVTTQFELCWIGSSIISYFQTFQPWRVWYRETDLVYWLPKVPPWLVQRGKFWILHALIVENSFPASKNIKLTTRTKSYNRGMKQCNRDQGKTLGKNRLCSRTSNLVSSISCLFRVSCLWKNTRNDGNKVGFNRKRLVL